MVFTLKDDKIKSALHIQMRYAELMHFINSHHINKNTVYNTCRYTYIIVSEP